MPIRPTAMARVRRSRALPFTRAGLKRAIAAAQDAGLRITAIRPDGTLEVVKAKSSAVDELEPEIVL
jgi:hypothetical protein